MSRGPGKWQRLILESIETQEKIRLIDLLPENYKHAEYSALYRAAHSLRRAGKIHMRFYDGTFAIKPPPGEPPQIWINDK